MPSFDIVSKIDLSELKNAVLNSMKEISQRYDFKGSISKIELENEYLVVHTEDDLKAKQVIIKFLLFMKCTFQQE